jgi:hypothetical protein
MTSPVLLPADPVMLGCLPPGTPGISTLKSNGAHIGAALAAGRVDEPRIEIGQPHIVAAIDGSVARFDWNFVSQVLS